MNPFVHFSIEEMIRRQKGNIFKAIWLYFHIHCELPRVDELPEGWSHDIWQELFDAVPDNTLLGQALKERVCQIND